MRLGYALSPSWDRSSPDDLADAEEWELRYRCFLGDVIFEVDEIDMGAPWGWVPVLDFALALERISRSLVVGDASEAVFEFTESDATIEFRVVDAHIEIEASYARGIANVAVAELRGRTVQFLEQMLVDLVGRHPALASNPLVVRRMGRAL